MIFDKRMSINTWALATAAAISISNPAFAQATRTFDIPAQPLSSALEAFGAQSDSEILFNRQQTEGRSAPEVRGVMIPAEALARLLVGSSLSMRQVNATTFVVSPAQQLQEVTQVDEVVVTGTLIRDTPPTSPVISFTRDDLDRGGYASTQDLFSKVPQNFSGATTATGGQTGYYTTNQIDLRGLGPESTLTLVNGRRLSRAAGHEGRAVDISMIPVSAIERVDILTDGASALYGADAVAGVVNLVLRDDFDGAETSVQIGSSDAGADNVLVSQTIGASWSSGRLLAAAQYDRRDAVTYEGLGITTSDLRDQGGGDFRFVGIGSPGTVYSAGFFGGMPFSTITGPGGAPVFSIALPEGDGRNLGVSDLALNQQSVLDFLPTDLTPEQENLSLYFTVEQDVGAVTLFADVVGARRDSRISLIAPVNYLMTPATNAFSPFSEPVMVGYQLTEFGFPSEFENTGWFANLGGRGDLGVGDWTWEIVGSFSEDVSKGFSIGYDAAALNARLASSDPAFAFNPFGDGSGQSPGVIEALLVDRFSEGRTSARTGSVQTQGSVADLPGGALRLALGAEYREESLESFRGSEGVVTETQFVENSQEAAAAFAEAYIPLFGTDNARAGLRELAFSAAARYESYDGFGDTFNPKIGVLWRPTDSLIIKSNWGTSFRAPSLRELHYPVSVNETAQVFDPNAPGGPATVFYTLTLGGNPDLEPETADTVTIGAQYRPAWLDGARLSANYYRIDYEQRITGAGDGLTQALLLEFEDSLPDGMVVRDADGNLLALSTAYVNSARTEISGWDVEAGFGWNDAWGQFDLAAAATVTENYADQIVPGAAFQEQAGVIGAPPEWRGRISLSWSNDPWGATVSVNHIDGMRINDPDPAIVRRDVASQTTTDLQFSFTPQHGSMWGQGVSIRAGVNNLFDRPSPFVDGPLNFGIGQQNFAVDGRSVYLRLTKAFGAGAR